MKILLLSIARLALERVVARLAINQHLARNNTHGGTSCQAVQECSFARSTHTHQGSKSTRLDPSVYVVENTSRLAFDLDVVAHVLPLENSGLALDDGDVVVRVVILCRNSSSSDSALEIIGGLALGYLVAATEHQNFTLGLRSSNVLSSDKVDGHESEAESP